MRAALLLALVGCGGGEGPAQAPPVVGAPKAAVPVPQHGPVIVERLPQQGDLTRILQEEHAEAEGRGMIPVVQFYADWCGPCVALREAMDDPAMQAAFDGVYVVRLQVDVWTPYVADGPFDHSQIPRFHGFDAEGRPTRRMITGDAWGDDTIENMAPVLDKFFHERIAKDPPAER